MRSQEKKLVINQPYPPENECLLRNIMGKSLTQWMSVSPLLGIEVLPEDESFNKE